MNRRAERTAMLDLPSGASRSALRAGLMALRVIPTALPNDRRGRDAVLHDLVNKPASAVFIDISQGGTHTAPTLLQLDAVVPRHACRQRVFLTRLAGGPGMGHVSEADRRWVRRLGFADLIAEFDALDCEGSLRSALDAVAQALALAPLSPADLARHARVMNEERDVGTARATLRSLTGLAAEELAALLALSLAIDDRTYHLQTYPQCFIGTEAVAWLARHLQRSTAEAVAVGQALMALGLLVHVTHDHPFLDERLYYRLAWSGAADELDLGAVLAGLTGDADGVRGVDVTDRSHLGKTYSRCWVGAQAVDHVVAHHAVTRHDAWLVLHRLMQFGLIEHVTRARPFIDGAFFYRFAGLPADLGAARKASA
jgi:hypothetical protein